MQVVHVYNMIFFYAKITLTPLRFCGDGIGNLFHKPYEHTVGLLDPKKKNVICLWNLEVMATPTSRFLENYYHSLGVLTKFKGKERR